MRFVGIDVAAERQVVAVVDDREAVLLEPTAFTEDAEGYQKLLSLLGPPPDALVAMEATGHDWKNLCAALGAAGVAVALLPPLRTRRFAGEDLQRTQTGALDALGIARFAAQKRPPATRWPDRATDELRALVRCRDRLVQDVGDRVRRLHRLVDLGVPEFTRYVRDLGSERATALLREYPTAAAFPGVSLPPLAGLRDDGRHKVGEDLATALRQAAERSVGRHHGEAHRIQVRCTGEDLDLLRRRLRDLEHDLERLLDDHEVGRLLTTIQGIGPQTSARLGATFGDFPRFPSGAALASSVGVIPGLHQPGQRVSPRARLPPLGAARLRAKLWMPGLTAVRNNPWRRAYDQGLLARGKLPRLALVAAMRKLLHAISSVATHRRPFVPSLGAAEGRA